MELKARNDFQRLIYHIVPNPMCGWDFKHAGAKNIIKYGSNRDSLRMFAESYCRTRACKLIVFDYIGEIADIKSFKGENK